MLHVLFIQDIKYAWLKWILFLKLHVCHVEAHKSHNNAMHLRGRHELVTVKTSLVHSYISRILTLLTTVTLWHDDASDPPYSETCAEKAIGQHLVHSKRCQYNVAQKCLYRFNKIQNHYPTLHKQLVNSCTWEVKHWNISNRFCYSFST